MISMISYSAVDYPLQVVPSVLADESVVLTGSFPLLLALAASGGSIAVGPNCPLAEERADSHVARKEPNVRPVAI